MQMETDSDPDDPQEVTPSTSPVKTSTVIDLETMTSSTIQMETDRGDPKEMKDPKAVTDPRGPESPKQMEMDLDRDVSKRPPKSPALTKSSMSDRTPKITSTDEIIVIDEIDDEEDDMDVKVISEVDDNKDDITDTKESKSAVVDAAFRTDSSEVAPTSVEGKKEAGKEKNKEDTETEDTEVEDGEEQIKTVYIMKDENEEEPIVTVANVASTENVVKKVFTPDVIEAASKKIPDGIILKDVSEITEKRRSSSALAAENGGGDSEVIDICDDDDEDDCDPETRLKRSKCINTNCRSGEGLDVCKASFVFQYFGFKKSKDQKVCSECFKLAFVHLENLVDMLEDGKPLFEADYPLRSDIVMLEDSSSEEDDGDEDSKKERREKMKDEMLSEDMLKLIDNELNDVLDKTMEKYNFDRQIIDNTKILENRMTKLELVAKEIDEKFDDALKRMDEFQWLVYKDFKDPTKEIDPIEIIDTIESEPQFSQPLQQTAGSTQQRRVRGLSMAASCGPGAPLLRPPAAPPYRRAQPPAIGVAMKKVTQVGSKPATSNQTFLEPLSQDVVALESLPVKAPPLPPIGAITRPKLEIGNAVYVMRLSFFTSWVRAKIIEVIQKPQADNNSIPELLYKVKLETGHNRKNPQVKVVAGRYMSYPEPSPVRLPVGTRIIAIFKDEGCDNYKDNYYSGIIAEVPKPNNKFRYLVFFDDGYAQYVPHENILLVCESSKNVWEDVHPDSKEFIKSYLSQYPERPMVKLNIDEVVKTEWNGKWWVARVKEIDGSLVKMYFDADERTEWIYRGSTRLGPLYIEMMAAKDRQGGKNRHASILKRRNMPYVEYTRNLDDKDGDEDELVKASELVPSRSVARKSTNKNRAQEPESNTGSNKLGPVDASVKPKPFIQQDHPGYFVKVNLAEAIKPRLFRSHSCNESCVIWTGYNVVKSKGMASLLRPLKFGFQRVFCEKRGKPLIMYITPCGRKVRTHDEMNYYLLLTRSNLTCDMFDFDPWVSCVTEYKLERSLTAIKDLSYEKENVPISCVNYVDHSYPDFVFYMTERRAMEGVNLNLDPNYLVGCDCTDNCADRSKCSCWQLTINGARSIPGMNVDEDAIGYQYRRLPDRVVSGIYECNSQCKCAHTCLNRVAQHPLSIKLQLYKTLMKGWGIRCLNDVPQGSFICIYAGNLLTEQAANEGGKNYGDEYLAELDYIEVMENLKEDYESDVVESDDERENELDADFNDEFESDGGCDNSQDSTSTSGGRGKNSLRYENDRDYRGNRNAPATNTNSIRERLRAREPDKKEKPGRKDKQDNRTAVFSSDDDDKDSKLRQPSNFSAVVDDDEERGKRFKSVREYYGGDECIYVMDAKNSGNIGRYLNHSCSPNVFVQNVFVDTHDLRFPWVAFFASRFIKAGDELTWDYNYDVGSVPGKVLYCYCGEPTCRRRLL